MSDTPHTDNMARGEHVVPTWFAKELEREFAKAHKAKEQLKEQIKELNNNLEHARSVKIVRIEFAKENKQQS